MADLTTLQTQLAKLEAALASGLRSVETPQLGRVEYVDADQIMLAISYTKNEIAALEGTAPPRTQPVVALRGLWPRSYEGSNL
jgi:hypothetical protein